MKMFTAVRNRMDEARTRRAVAHLDDHLRRDIGLLPREPRPSFRHI